MSQMSCRRRLEGTATGDLTLVDIIHGVEDMFVLFSIVDACYVSNKINKAVGYHF